MLLFIFIIICCFYIGFLLSKFLREIPDYFRKTYITENSFSFTKSSKYCACGILLHSCSYFDSRHVQIPFHANQNLQKIFDIVVERFITSWFSQLSSDKRFPADVKAQLQHICSVILLRLKTIDIPVVIEKKLLPCALHHVEHLLTLTNVCSLLRGSEGPDDSLALPLSDEVILQRLYSACHLHPALLSRQSESEYLQNIVHTLLPRLLLPPSLRRQHQLSASIVPPLLSNQVDDYAYSSAQFYHQMPKISQLPVFARSSVTMSPSNQCAATVLAEILANHLLLPALDSIANPDALNTGLLYLLNPIADDMDYPNNAPMVPLLASYIDDWKACARNLPEGNRIEALLQQPEQLGNFVQYMKSINCSTSMTVLLLMFELMNKFDTNAVSVELCEQLRAPLHQLLLLLHCGRVIADTCQFDRQQPFPAECFDCGWPVLPESPQLQDLLGLPSDFTKVIQLALASQDTLSIARLVHTPQWISAYHSVCETIETLYIPTYLESPEYIKRKYSQRANLSPAASFSVLGNSNMETNQLKTVLDYTDVLIARKAEERKNSPKRPSLNNSLSDLKDFFNSSSSKLHSSNHQQQKDDVDFLKKANQFEQQPQLYEDEVGNIDMLGWSVSVPAYHRPGSSRNLPSSTLTAASMRQPDLSLLNYTPSRFGCFTVQSERGTESSRIVIAKVDRKLSEFYALEQKLILFHGESITCRLPSKRPVGPRFGEILEHMRPRLEFFLQYLVGQPFLRSSELLFSFLTSREIFTSSYLPEINLGKFVKSVPIYLAKERGQYLDEFLNSFRSSCISSNSFTSSMSSGSGSFAPTGPPARSTHSLLEHRLRSRFYWNNAGISLQQKRVRISKHCSLEGNYITSFYDLFGYLLENFRRPQLLQGAGAGCCSHRYISPPENGKNSLFLDISRWLWRILEVIWVNSCSLTNHLIGAFQYVNYFNSDSPGTGNSSVLAPLLRRAFVILGLRLRPIAQPLFDHHMRDQLHSWLGLLVQNEYLAPMLLILKDNIFFPDPPRSDREKAERRKKVSFELRKLINRFHLQWFSEDDMLQRRFERIFELFQHPKWNKQLTYDLLDHILLELFPDVFEDESHACSTPN